MRVERQQRPEAARRRPEPLCDAWPQADVFTAVYDEAGTEGRFAHRRPRTSFRLRLPIIEPPWPAEGFKGAGEGGAGAGAGTLVSISLAEDEGAFTAP